MTYIGFDNNYEYEDKFGWLVFDKSKQKHYLCRHIYKTYGCATTELTEINNLDQVKWLGIVPCILKCTEPYLKHLW